MTDEQSGRNVRAVLIPADRGGSLTAGPADVSPAGLWTAVGGAEPEAAPPEATTLLYVDGYGKSNGLPRNGRATALADAIRPGFALADHVAGPALVVGSDPERGQPCDVYEEALDDWDRADQRQSSGPGRVRLPVYLPAMTDSVQVTLIMRTHLEVADPDALLGAPPPGPVRTRRISRTPVGS